MKKVLIHQVYECRSSQQSLISGEKLHVILLTAMYICLYILLIGVFRKLQGLRGNYVVFVANIHGKKSPTL